MEREALQIQNLNLSSNLYSNLNLTPILNWKARPLQGRLQSQVSQNVFEERL